MRAIRLVCGTLGLLCIFGWAGAPAATAQVVIDERVELTRSRPDDATAKAAPELDGPMSWRTLTYRPYDHGLYTLFTIGPQGYELAGTIELRTNAGRVFTASLSDIYTSSVLDADDPYTCDSNYYVRQYTEDTSAPLIQFRLRPGERIVERTVRFDEGPEVSLGGRDSWIGIDGGCGGPYLADPSQLCECADQQPHPLKSYSFFVDVDKAVQAPELYLLSQNDKRLGQVIQEDLSQAPAPGSPYVAMSRFPWTDTFFETGPIGFETPARFQEPVLADPYVTYGWDAYFDPDYFATRDGADPFALRAEITGVPADVEVDYDMSLLRDGAVVAAQEYLTVAGDSGRVRRGIRHVRLVPTEAAADSGGAQALWAWPTDTVRVRAYFNDTDIGLKRTFPIHLSDRHLQTDVEFGRDLIKQGGERAQLQATVQGFPIGTEDVAVRMSAAAEALGSLQDAEGDPVTGPVPFSRIRGQGSEIYYVADGPKDHAAALRPKEVHFSVEPAREEVFAETDTTTVRVGGYDYKVTLGSDQIEPGDTTTVDIDPIYPDSAAVVVPDDVLLHQFIVYGYVESAAPDKRGTVSEVASKNRAASNKAGGDPSWRTEPTTLNPTDCRLEGTPSNPLKIVVPDSMAGLPMQHVKQGCDPYGRQLVVNLPQHLASQDTLLLVSDTSTYRPKAGEQVRVVVQAAMSDNNGDSSFGEASMTVVPTLPDTILLGETAYYQAIEDPQDNAKLKLMQLSDPSQASSNRVQNVDWTVTPEAGDRLGVYYDTEYYDEVDITRVAQDDVQAKPSGPRELPAGLIRITGRFWTPETTYTVNLSASENGRAGGTQIVVKQPDRLGEGPLRDLASYQLPRAVEDVFGTEYNIDSLCIAYGGRYGIPPQYIKGQARRESVGFQPSYRYEPLTTQFGVDEIQEDGGRDWTESPFFVTEGSMGTGQGLPSDHVNVRPELYPQEPQTVWAFLTSHSDLEGTWNGRPKYVLLRDDGTLNFGPYSSAEIVYEDFLNKIDDGDGEFSDREKQLAIDSTTVNLREEWTGPAEYESGPGGLDNMIAQTRTGSSYGLLQILYKRAIDPGETPEPYPITDADTPERLNENDVVFPLNMRSQIKELRDILGIGAGGEVPDSNWRSGNLKTYEQVLFKMYHRWNPGKPRYEQNIFGFSQDFLPIEE